MINRREILGILGGIHMGLGSAGVSAQSLTDAARVLGFSKKYKWLPTESAPKLFPVSILKGSIKLEDGRVEGFPMDRDANNGWGKRGSTRIVGPEKKAVPVSLYLRWLSLTEDVFYEGEFPLPKDKIGAFLENPLARARLVETPEPFTRLIGGMAPGGWVSVWLAAGAEVVEVGTYQAQKIEVPWTEVTENTQMTREEYINDVLRERFGFYGIKKEDTFSKEQLPGARNMFESYSQRYDWSPKFTLSGTPLYMNIESFNGENARIWPTGPAVHCQNRPVPSVIETAWIPAEPQSVPVYWRFTLNEQEVFDAFNSLLKSDRSIKLRVVMKVNMSQASISVESPSESVPLLKAERRLIAL